MIDTALAVALLLLLAAGFGLVLRGDDRRLRRQARRLRQLEHEGIEELRRDPFPEAACDEGAFLREPDGDRADTEKVLHDDLHAAREHTRRLRRGRTRTRLVRRQKGAECLH